MRKLPKSLLTIHLLKGGVSRYLQINVGKTPHKIVFAFGYAVGYIGPLGRFKIGTHDRRVLRVLDRFDFDNTCQKVDRQFFEITLREAMKLAYLTLPEVRSRGLHPKEKD